MIDSQGGPQVQDLEVLEIDRCRSDAHCSVGMKLVNPIKEIHDPNSLTKRKLTKTWNTHNKWKYQRGLDLELARVCAPTKQHTPKCRSY